MSRVMILTAMKTGLGHRASANAIEKQLRERGIDTLQVDGFTMGKGKKTGPRMESIYIPMTTRAPHFYYIMQRLTVFFPWPLHEWVYRGIRKKFPEELRLLRPDLILSVHCIFTKAVSRVLREEGIDIPFHIDVIDLVNPPTVWEDPGAERIFVPTEDIRNAYLKKGFRAEQLTVAGFPVRGDIHFSEDIRKPDEQLRILMVNPSVSLRRNVRFLEETAQIPHARIDFICGLDQRLYACLRRRQEKGDIPPHVQIHGFVDDMNRYMEQSHVILTKAGPNAIIEAVRAGTPIILTGHIRGQESHNHRFVEENGYGIRCEDPQKIRKSLEDFISSGHLQRCRENMQRDPVPNGAEIIAEMIAERLT